MFVNCIKIPSFAIKKTKIRVKVSGKDPKYQTQNSLTCKPDKNTTYHQSEIFDSEPFTTKTKTTARIDKKTKKLYSNYTKPNLNKNKKIVHKSILSSYNTNKNKLEFKESKLQINPGKTVSNFYRAQNSLEFTNTEPGFYKKFSKVDDKKFIRSGSLNPKSNNTQNYDIGREMALKRTNSTNIKKNNSTKKNVVINKGNKSKTTQKIVKIETINTTINNNKEETKKNKKPFFNLDKKVNKQKTNQKLFSKILNNSKEYNKSVNVEILNIEDYDKTNNDSTINNNITIPQPHSDYTGFILVKQIRGENVLEIKFPDSNIKEINNILKTKNFVINNKQVLLIQSDELKQIQNIKDENKRLTEENYKIMEEYEEIRTELFTLKLEEGKLQPESSENNIYTPNSQTEKNEEIKEEEISSNKKEEDEDSVDGLRPKDNIDNNLLFNCDDNSNIKNSKKNSSNSNIIISNRNSNSNIIISNRNSNSNIIFSNKNSNSNMIISNKNSKNSHNGNMIISNKNSKNSNNSNMLISNKNSDASSNKLKNIQNKIAAYKSKLKSNFRMSQKLMEKKDRKNSSFDDKEFENTAEQLCKIPINRSATKKYGPELRNTMKRNWNRDSGIFKKTMQKRSNNNVLSAINNQDKNNLGKISKKSSIEVQKKNSKVSTSSNNKKVEIQQEKKEKTSFSNVQNQISQKSSKGIPKIEKKVNKGKYRQSIKILGLAKQLEDMINNMNINKSGDNDDDNDSSSEKEDTIKDGNAVELIQEIPIQKKGRKKPKKSIMITDY